MTSKAEADQAAREAKINAAKSEAKAGEKDEDFDYGAFGTGLDNIGATADNTGRMADSMELSQDDLKYLRDIAERDAINKFTTAEVKLDFTANANLNSNMDIDGFVNQFTTVFQEQLVSTAEGVHQ